MPATLQINNNGQLTSREAEVLQLLAWGKDNEEIGMCLGIGKRTAKDHVEHAMHKLHANNRTRLVTEAFRQGILRFICLLLVIQAGVFIPLQTASEQNQQNPFRTRSGSTRRIQISMRFTRSVQLRVNRRA